MTQDEIIEMARQAGYLCLDLAECQRLEDFAKLVTARYEQKIQDLEDMITEIQEKQE